MKNPLTLAGIEEATFRFVAQHLNHCATAVPRKTVLTRYKSLTLYIDKIKITPLRASVTLHINKMENMCHLGKEHLSDEAD